MNYSKQIQQRIEEAAEETVFIGSEFADIAGKDTIRRNLLRLTQKNIIGRTLKGIYEKPKFINRWCEQFVGQFKRQAPDFFSIQ